MAVTCFNDHLSSKPFSVWAPASLKVIPEPKTRKKVFPDVLIVPLVGFDKNKFRLGYGGGFYDRYIKKLKRNFQILSSQNR